MNIDSLNDIDTRLSIVIDDIKTLKSFCESLRIERNGIALQVMEFEKTKKEIESKKFLLDNDRMLLDNQEHNLNIQEKTIETKENALATALDRFEQSKKNLEDREKTVVEKEIYIQGKLKEIQTINTKRKELEDREKVIEKQTMVLRDREQKTSLQETHNERERLRLQSIADSMK